MQKFSIKFDQRNLNKIFRAADKIVVIATTQQDALPKTGAEEYANKVLKGINRVRWKYAGKYNQRYLDWKMRNYKIHVPWKLESDLVRALGAYKISSGAGESVYVGGVKAGIYDSGGKSWFGSPGGKSGPKGPPKEIAMYGRTVERTKPMFVPIWKEYKPMYLKKVGKVVMQIRRTWR